MSVLRSFMGLMQKLQANQDDARIVEIATESPTARAIKADLEDDQKRWLVVGICLHSVISPALRTYIPPVVSKLYNKLQQSDNIHQQTYPNQLKRYRPTNKELNYEAINNNVTIPKVRGKRDEPKYDFKVMNGVDLSKLFLQTHMAHYSAFDDTCDSSALLGIIIGLDVFPPLVKQAAEKVRADIRNAWAHCNFAEWDIIKYQTTFQMMHQFVRNLVLPLQDEAVILGKLTHWETNGIQFLHGTTLGLELVTELKTETGAIARYLRDVVTHTDDSLKDVLAAILDIDKNLDQLKNDILTLTGTCTQLTTDMKTVKENVDNLNVKTDDIVQTQEKQGVAIQKVKEGVQEIETKLSEVGSKGELEILSKDLKDIKIHVDKNRAEIDSISKYFLHSKPDKMFFYPPNRLRSFICRDDEIDELMQKFIAKGSEHALQVICGLGGTGKTSIAIEFSWRYQSFYPGGVFWMSAESNDVLEDSFQRLSIDVDTIGSNAKETMHKTLKWLSSLRERWLLVIDNVDMEEIRGSIKELILGPWKRKSTGHILITSRRESSLAEEEFNILPTDCLTLEALSNQESIKFMEFRIGFNSQFKDESLVELVEELGGLPLALEQAAAHIKALKCSFAEYLERFRQKRLKLLRQIKAPYEISKERQTVNTTWQLNFDYIEKQSEDDGLGSAAKTVMNVISFLFPDDIPLELINVGTPEICFEDLRDTLQDKLASRQIVEILTRFSLFQWCDSNSISVHRLVQEVVRDSIKSSDELQKIVLSAIRMVHYALKQQPTPNDAMKEENIGRTSLKHWSRLSYHASSLKAHLFGSRLSSDLETICFNLETAKILQTAAIYHSLAQRQDQAMEAQDRMLNVITAVDVSEKDFSDLTAIKIPLMNKERLIIQGGMAKLMQSETNIDEGENQSSELDVESYRKKGNDAFRSNQYMDAIQYYTVAIVESRDIVDPKLLANRSLSYYRAGDYENALRDSDKCIQLDPKCWKGYCWKSYAIAELVKLGSLPQSWKSVGLAAASVAGHLNGNCLLEYRMKIEYPLVRFSFIENEKKLGAEISSLHNYSYTTLLLRKGRHEISSERGEFPTKSVQVIGIDDSVEIVCQDAINLIRLPSSAFRIKLLFEPQINVYFENVIFSKGTGQIFVGTNVCATFYKCKFSNGLRGCEDYPQCRGGKGCVNTDRNICKINTELYEKMTDSSGGGVSGCPGICVGSTAMPGGKAIFQNCLFDRCGGGGLLCEGEGSVIEMNNCVSKNMIQMGAEARCGGSIVAENCIFMDNQTHGIAIGPSGRGHFRNCKVQGNKREGFWCGRIGGIKKDVEKISVKLPDGGSICSIYDCDIFQNGMCGISLEGGSYDISGNKIFENWMWGIMLKSRSSTTITNNDIFENKCGGIRLGVNYSAPVFLDGNSIRDHSGPYFHVEKTPENVVPRTLPDDMRMSETLQQYGFLRDENTCYSLTPTITNRNLFKGNNRGFQHPNKLIEVLQTCCCCHKMWNKLKSCSKCKKAQYCSKDCQSVHWQRHKHICKLLTNTFNVDVDMSTTKKASEFFHRNAVLTNTYPMQGAGEGIPPDRSSSRRFIVKVLSGREYTSYDPNKHMYLYDQTRSLDIWFQSPQIYQILNECGILGANQLTTKKIYCWASFKRGGKTLCLHTENLAPVQTW